MSIEFGWWNKDPDEGKYQVVAAIHGGNIEWTRHRGHHTPWEPYQPNDDDRTRLIDYYDLGQATYAMALAAADLGIGTGHSSVGDQDQARKILGVPGDHDVAFLIGVGHPADRPLRPIAKPNRRPLDEVIHHGGW